MKILITGSRNWTDREAIRKALRGFPLDSIVIDGAARGADFIAHSVAEEFGYGRARFPAQWAKDGKRAGPLRNQRMLDIAKPDICLAFPLADSIGTVDMMERCQRAGIPVMRLG